MARNTPHISMTALALMGALVVVAVPSAFTGDMPPTQDCIDEKPLATFAVVAGVEPTGRTVPVQMPPVAGSSRLTAFEVSIQWVRSKTDPWIQLTPHFAFPEPGRVGLPFNVFQVEWVLSGVDGSETRKRFDFTSGCEGPGIALFPNQESNVTGAAIKIGPEIQAVSLSVWGSRF